ncbi:MAG TPA: DAK2 domain-containing protein [Trueperaceae bacterium]
MADTLPKEPRTIPARELSRAFIFATDWLGVYVDEINALNVYPVPDGDTGTNMHLTMQSVRRQILAENPTTMTSLCHALAYGSLLGARGNSGVILSQVLKGFSEEARRLKELDAEGLRKALHGASRTAYSAVMKPVEGTILTVVRRAAEGSDESPATLPLDVLREAHGSAQVALERTPEMLPLLKQAGVVDAGGLGFVRLLEGLIAFFEGRDLPPPPKVEKRAQQQFEEEEFGFCTEFLLSDVKVATREIQTLVEPFGDSLLVVGAEGFVKGHIHTEEPEKLLATVSKYGTMVRSKVEDMSEQHSEILATVDMDEAEPPLSAMVAVSDGYGISKAFRGLGARVVGGGQTNNPSVEDIADAVRSVGAKQVVVLPNNKNIIMAAQRVADIVKDKEIEILPTRTMGAGLAAAVLFQENQPLSDLLPAMQEAADSALTLEVTKASRTVTVEDVEVSEGEFIGLANDRLEVSASDPVECLMQLLERHAEEYEIATLFHSAAIEPDEAEELAEKLGETYPELEVEVRAGAPDLYPYVMALE